MPLARALGEIADVRVVVPDRERSWVGKAITRYEDLVTETVVDRGISIVTVSGFPADCVQLGVFNLFETAPDIVVSGINVGANHGQAYLTGSGTVGAAVEAAIIGLPAIAFSAAKEGEWVTWKAWAESDRSDPMWERLGRVATEITASVLDTGLSADVHVLKVELPAAADVDTPRRFTAAAPVRYGRLFEEAGPGRFHHRYPGGLYPIGPMEGTDFQVVEAGEIAMTGLHIDTSVPVSEGVRIGLERA